MPATNAAGAASSSEHVPLSSGASSSAPARTSAGGVVNAAGQRLANWQRKTVKTLSRMKIPFKAPSLIDRTQPYFSGIARFGITGFWNMVNDPFHTMLNMPWRHFIAMFFAMYFIEYLLFAFLFYIQGDYCVQNMDSKFSHALWMSSRTASTLGFNEISPNPECGFLNFCVMIEVVSSSLINFIMLGVVFARFSAPFKRASTVRFSKNAVCHSHPSGYWAISMRVANLRKHQILQPSIRLVVTAIDSITPSNYMFEHLKVEAAYAQETNIELGFPANLVHVITPDSYLYNLSLLEMDTRMMEILVFVDGIDAMTSKHMSAKFSYSTNDIMLNQVHVPLNLEMRGKKLGLDFKDFDKTVAASSALEDEMNMRKAAGADASASVHTAAAAAGAEATAQVGWQLRHQTFRRLAERYGPRAGPSSSNGNGVASGAGTGAAPGTGTWQPAPAAEGPFEGSYLQYKRRVSAVNSPAVQPSSPAASHASYHSGGHQGHGQGQAHVALTIGVPGTASGLEHAGAGPASGSGGGQGSGYAPLMLHSPDAVGPAPGRMGWSAGGREVEPLGGAQVGTHSEGGVGHSTYQPPAATSLLQSHGAAGPNWQAQGQGPQLSRFGVGGGAGQPAQSVVVVSPELAAATPHMWDSSVSGLAPYAHTSNVGGADAGPGQGVAAAGSVSSGGGAPDGGSGGGAALPVSSGASEPTHASGNPFTLL